MTRATILQLRDEYAAILDHAGAVAEHIYNTRHVVRALEDQQMMLNHARWVCDEILRQIDNLGGQQLCVRYLGILQAFLVVYGLVTIQQTRARLDEFCW